MEEKKLSLLHVDHLPIEEASSLFNLTVADAILVKSEISEIGNAVLTEFETNATAFRTQVNRSQKNKLTDLLNAERKTCSDVFAEIKKITVFESTSRDAAKKTAATDFRLLLNPYWDMSKGPIGDQIDLTIEIGLKYNKDAALKSAAQTIAVDTLMTELITGNATLYATFNTRELDNGKQEPSSSDLRPAVTDSFIKFSNIIEQSANYAPNPAILDLFIKMDELRKRYHALIPPKKIK